MIIYFLIFVTIFIFSLVASIRVPTSSSYYSSNLTVDWYFIIFILSIFIGLRHQVGGDWYIYEEQAIEILFADSVFDYISLKGDLGYYLISYLSAKLGAHVYLANYICALIFSFGLAVICRTTSRPILSLAAAFPYLIIVVAMGYTRQSVAIGLILIGISYLIRQKLGWFIAMIFLATLFHKTALVFLPIGIFVLSRNKFLSFGSIIIFGLVAFFVFLESYIDNLIWAYVSNDPESSGALIRLSMNIVPSVLFFIFYKRFNISEIERKIFLVMSLISVSLFILYFATSITTALDRIGLYMLPLQMLIFSRLPELFNDRISKTLVFSALFAYFFLVLFVWLNFATHSYLWVPYNSVLINWLN